MGPMGTAYLPSHDAQLIGLLGYATYHAGAFSFYAKS